MTQHDVQDGTTTSKTFVHTPSTIQAEEAEEIGVEHLLRDIRDVAVGTLSTRITSQLQSLQGLHFRLRDIGTYLGKVAEGKLPVNHAILGNLQDVFNLLPGLSAPLLGHNSSQANGFTSGSSNGAGHLLNGTAKDAPHPTSGVPPGVAGDSELARAMSVKTNDQLMSIYLSSLIRAITAFHDLIENKVQNRQLAEDKEKSKADARKEREQKLKDKEAKKKGDDKNQSVEENVINGSSADNMDEDEKK